MTLSFYYPHFFIVPILDDRICSAGFVHGALVITVQVSNRRKISKELQLTRGMEISCNKINHCSAGGRKRGFKPGHKGLEQALCKQQNL